MVEGKFDEALVEKIADTLGRKPYYEGLLNAILLQAFDDTKIPLPPKPKKQKKSGKPITLIEQVRHLKEQIYALEGQAESCEQFIESDWAALICSNAGVDYCQFRLVMRRRISALRAHIAGQTLALGTLKAGLEKRKEATPHA